MTARVVCTYKEFADFCIKGPPDHSRTVEIIKNNFIKLDRNAHLLDIGSGAACAVDLLEKDFNEISLIEPNKYFRSEWCKSWINDDKHTLHLYPFTIEHVVNENLIKENSVDTIIVYHPIYHFEIEILKQTINKIMSYLKPDG